MNKLIKIFSIVICLVILSSIFGCVDKPSGNEPEENADGKFNVVIEYCSSGGCVTVDKNKIEAGEEFVITITSETNFKLITLMVNDNNEVSSVRNNVLNCEGYFSDVKIKAYFIVDAESQLNSVNSVNYVADDMLPIIDGEIDSIWNTAPKLYVVNIHETNGTFVEEISWVKVLWNEKGLYFLANVNDKTVVDMDTCNFWVSETYTSANIAYSSNPTVTGHYFICMSSSGVPREYEVNWDGAKLDIAPYLGGNVVKKVESGYVVEIYVPVISLLEFSEGNFIGFDVSIDYYDGVDDNSIDKHRDAYTNLFGLGSYWNRVGALKKLELIK